MWNTIWALIGIWWAKYVKSKIGVFKRYWISKNIKFSEKIIIQMNKRWWSKKDIESVIKNPYKIGRTIDNYWGKIWNKWEEAIAYFLTDNQYVVVNNKSYQIIQISDRNDPNWIVDSRIYDIR